MKNIPLLLLLISSSMCSFAQAPQKMNYQAIIRNNTNALIVNQTVRMKIGILQGSINGTLVYEEIHTPNTNANGLASLEIGTGSVLKGRFDTINWARGPYFIETETDPTGGTNYNISSVSQLLSVPYALYAERAKRTDTAMVALATPQQPSVNFPTGKGITFTAKPQWQTIDISQQIGKGMALVWLRITNYNSSNVGSEFVFRKKGDNLDYSWSSQNFISLWQYTTGMVLTTIDENGLFECINKSSNGGNVTITIEPVVVLR